MQPAAVNDGKIERVNTDLFVPFHTTADTSNRITLPRHFSEKITWLQGKEPLRGWLLLVDLGRFRLLSDQQVQNDPQLEPVRFLILEGKPPEELEPTTRAEKMERAAFIARLQPATLTPPPPGWRLAFPRTFDIFRPADCDERTFSVFLSLEGFWEIWHTDVLRRAGTLPLSQK